MSDNETLKEQLLDAAVLRGEFTLSSGKTSDYYVDKYLFETEPGLLDAITDRIADRFAGEFDEVDRLAVPALGGVPLGSVLSIKLDLPYVIIRKKEKEYGTGSQIEGEWEEGDRVIIVEDVVTTGGESIRTIQSLREENLEVTGVICVVNRQEGGEENIAEHDLPLHSVFTVEELGLV